MRNASSAFQRALADGRRDYIYKVIITLDDGYDTPIPGRAGENYLDNEDIWEGGLQIDDAVSEDNVFQVGAAIINQCTVVLNNIDGYFDDYDFDNAKVIPYVGFANLDDNTTEYLRMGTYSVDEAGYNGTTITLTCLDGMSVFDQPYNNHNMYPATLHDIVSTACTDCGVILATPLFHRYGFTVSTPPSDESTTYRQVISWCAQIAGSFARFNDIGQLEIKFYNIAAVDALRGGYNGGVFDDGTPYYTSGDNLDGGIFNPWDSSTVVSAGTFDDGTRGDVAFIDSDYSSTVAVDNVVLTGVKVVTKNTDDDAASSYVDYTYGQEGYVVSIEENELIAPSDVQTLAQDLGSALIGLTFRKANITHPSDPTIEAGDVGIYIDRKGNQYPIIISSTTFTSGSAQNTNSSAASVKKNSSQRFTEATKNYVELRKQIQTQKTQWETVTDDLADRIEAAGGLYCTEVTDTSGTKTYYHDKPLLSESDIVMLFSDVGFTMTANYQDQSPTWYGMTVDGQMIASQLHALSTSFVWAIGGQMTLGGANNGNGILRVVSAQGNLVGRWDNNGIWLNGGTLESPNITSTYRTSTVAFNNAMLTFTESTADVGYRSAGSISSSAVYDSEVGHNVGNLSISSDGGIFFHVKSSSPLSVEPYLDENNVLKYRASMTNADINNAEIYSLYVGEFVSGSAKPRLVDTEDYGNRLLYCYETPSPMFGDVGEGVIGDDGMCYITLDPIFSKTIADGPYQVFLQKYRDGKCYVSERHPGYFVVCGEPGIAFGWEIKAKQFDASMMRLDKYEKQDERLDISNSVDYAADAEEHINSIREERYG